jgi:hypothetical protein
MDDPTSASSPVSNRRVPAALVEALRLLIGEEAGVESPFLKN